MTIDPGKRFSNLHGCNRYRSRGKCFEVFAFNFTGHAQQSPALHEYIKDRELFNILFEFDCSEEQLLQLITMSSVVESAEELKEKEELEKPKVIGGMVKVPGGEFLYGEDKKKEIVEQPFEIDIYPVTNGQYKAFIESNGYGEDKYWSEEGRKWRDENKVKQPGYWDDERFNHPEQPVVGISYYEAEAFAKWSGKRLPTEKEWEKAARGTDGRIYPWGDKFDKEKCNSEESGIGKTTRVTVYPAGVSPYGCHDMAGNVWEWCSDLYSKDGSYRVLRGGSWGHGARDCRASFRRANRPSRRWNGCGLRLARN